MTSLPSRTMPRHRHPTIGRRLPDQRPGAQRRWLPFAVALGGAAPFLLIALLLASGSDPRQVAGPGGDAPAAPTTSEAAADAPSTQAAADYAAGIHELALAAGQIIELEMKPGITDIREQAYDDDVLQGFSDRWAADFADLRDGLATVQVPAGLEESHRLYVSALDGYRETALLFSRAVQVPVDQREAALQEAISRGEATDEVWDRGQDLLAIHLRDLGLDPTRWLPVGGG